MEWVVGQWVDYRGEPAKIEKIDNALTVRFMNGSSVRLCLETAFVSPFVWQVGKTYRTTLEGVTATIKYVAEAGYLCGFASSDQDDGFWAWNSKSGQLVALEASTTDPHLLPYLADEPASEPTPPLSGELPPLPSRYHRRTKGVVIDLYDIAEAYGLQGHAEFHALKKIIMAGNRGYKDRDQDLAEAIVSIERAREMAKGGAE